MSEISSEESEKSSEVAMSRAGSAAEAVMLVQRIAGARSPGESVKAVIGRVCRSLRKFGLSANRVRDLWYADPRVSVRVDELEALRSAAADVESKKHVERLFAAAASLEAIDEDFHRQSIDQLREIARSVSDVSRAHRLVTDR